MFDVTGDPVQTARMCIGTDRGRWWADPTFGSRLYMLHKEKIDGQTAAKVRAAISEAITWMVKDALITAFSVEVEIKNKRVDWKLTLSLSQNTQALIEGGYDGH